MHRPGQGREGGEEKKPPFWAELRRGDEQKSRKTAGKANIWIRNHKKQVGSDEVARHPLGMEDRCTQGGLSLSLLFFPSPGKEHVLI